MIKYTPHYTVDDYRQWPGDWELWQGAAVSMTPSPFGRHQLVGAHLVRLLGNALVGTDFHVLYEIDWIISNETVVRPDIVVTHGIVPERHLNEPPTLVVEILSPTTAEKDRTVKRLLYQQQQVNYYLIVDPTARNMSVCELQNGQFVEHSVSQDLTLKFGNQSVVLKLSEVWG